MSTNNLNKLYHDEIENTNKELELNMIYNMDCLEGLKQLPDNSIDSCVTDPPYGLSKEPNITEVLTHWLNDTEYKHPSKGFMGKEWDSFVPAPTIWKEVYRVLKPGAYILCFAGTRTYDLMTMSLRLAGFEIRDQIQWIYGIGMPKSQDLNKQHEKRYGVSNDLLTGYGTGLKPAHEPICVARKPLSENNVLENVLKWSTGGLNIDRCRIEYEEGGSLASNPSLRTHINGGNGGNIIAHEEERRVVIPSELGRFPANIILDDVSKEIINIQGENTIENKEYAKEAKVSRFFFCPKASKKERGEGNNHPTVKPLRLMEYLVKLVTPKNGIVLDPFAGSGTTLLGAKNEGFKYIGYELENNSWKICNERLT